MVYGNGKFLENEAELREAKRDGLLRSQRPKRKKLIIKCIHEGLKGAETTAELHRLELAGTVDEVRRWMRYYKGVLNGEFMEVKCSQRV